jgi:hypothetical protein
MAAVPSELSLIIITIIIIIIKWSSELQLRKCTAVLNYLSTGDRATMYQNFYNENNKN